SFDAPSLPVGVAGSALAAVAAVHFGGVLAVAALHEVGVVAWVPDHVVVPSIAEHLVVAVAADEQVVAFASVQHLAAGAAYDGVVAAAAVDDELVDGLEASNVGYRGEAGDRGRSAVRRRVDDVITLSALHDHLVDGTVAGTGAGGGGEVHVHLRDVGGGEIVHGDAVGAAARGDVDALDVVQVHGDRADVAGEECARAVRRDVHVFRDVGAVEEHRVVAVAAFDAVAAVAPIPLGRVVSA